MADTKHCGDGLSQNYLVLRVVRFLEQWPGVEDLSYMQWTDYKERLNFFMILQGGPKKSSDIAITQPKVNILFHIFRV